MNLIDKLRRDNAELKMSLTFGNCPAWVISDTISDMQNVILETLTVHALLTDDQEYAEHVRKEWFMSTGKDLPLEIPEDIQQYLEYLDGLRESGQANMFDAPRILMETYPEIHNFHTARAIFWYWKATLEERMRPNED